MREMALKGEAGITLHEKDYTRLSRYKPVMSVNDLTRKSLVRYQYWGIIYNYLTPRRLWYNLTRAGLKAAVRNGWAFGKSLFLKKHDFKARE